MRSSYLTWRETAYSKKAQQKTNVAKTDATLTLSDVLMGGLLFKIHWKLENGKLYHCSAMGQHSIVKGGTDPL